MISFLPGHIPWEPFLSLNYHLDSFISTLSTVSYECKILHKFFYNYFLLRKEVCGLITLMRRYGKCSSPFYYNMYNLKYYTLERSTMCLRTRVFSFCRPFAFKRYCARTELTTCARCTQEHTHTCMLKNSCVRSVSLRHIYTHTYYEYY